MHNAHAHARHTRHKAHAHDTTAHAHLVCDCRHTQAARALTRHVRSHSSLRSRRPNSPSSGLLATRTTHAPHAPPTPPRMDTRTHHVHVLTHRLGVAWEKRPADSTLVRVRQGFTIRSRRVAPSSAPSGCSAAHRSMSGPRTDIDVWTQMTCTHTSPPPPHTHAPTNIASHRQAITPSAVASADQAGSRPGGSSYAPPRPRTASSSAMDASQRLTSRSHSSTHETAGASSPAHTSGVAAILLADGAGRS